MRLPTGPFVSVGSKQRAVVWAVGDGADGGEDAKALARTIAKGKPDLFLYLGDVYQRGTAEEFRDNYETVYGALGRRAAPTPGNHEWGRHTDGYDPYWRRVTGKPVPAFYSLRLAGWQLLSLNSEAPHDSDSAQVRWLRRQLRGTGTCRLAFWHRPRFSAGEHGDYADMAPLWNALRGRATIVVAAHDHAMQRFKRRDGIVELVSGAGGRSHYDVDEDDPRLAFSNDTEWGALRLELRPGRASWAFVTTEGRTLDRGSLACRRR